MRKFIVFSFLFLVFLFPSPALADEGWIINQFNSQINIQKDGRVLINETINADFADLIKHGIYRDIPYIYTTSEGKKYTEIKILQVLQNNSSAKYTISRTNGYIELKIGDANRTITGKNVYIIQYLVTGILKSFPDYDELYWNATGNSWPVPVNSAYAQIKLPADAVIQIKCFEGYTGSIDPCTTVNQNADSASFMSSRVLNPDEGLTIVVGYKKDIVPVLEVPAPVSLWQKFVSWPSRITLISALIFGMGTILFLWIKFGRDYWYARNLFGKKDEQGTVKPLIAHETIVVEFTPPDKLRPAEIGVLADETANTNDVTAMIIDLAGRGYIHINEIPKKWIFGKTDYEFHKKKTADTHLRNYEKLLLEKLFNKRQSVTLSSLRTTFYEELKEVKDELYKEVVDMKFFPASPDKVRLKYLLISVLVLFSAIIIIFFSISAENIITADLGFGAVVSGLVLTVVSRFMPRRTAYGRQLYKRIKGYRLFISSAEKYRQQFFEKKNLFNEVLPYAIVFGLTEKFARAMKEIGLEAEKPGWYSGASAFSTHVFAGNMNDFSHSLSSAMASAPSSSGFSGGGSSGGGFGGGGGGSW